MSFTQIEHPLVGTIPLFIAQGYSPYQPIEAQPGDKILLPNFDRVTVLSAWTRPYLDESAPILLYVQSHTTGECTHVPIYDLKSAF